MAFIGVPLRPSLIARNAKPACSPRRRAANRVRCVPRAAAKAREVSASELEVALQANERPLLVDAFATWCGPCQFLIPHLDTVAEKYGDRLDVLKFNTEVHADLASALMVRGLPTLFFIKDGKLRYRMEGAMTADDLEKLVDYVLFDGPAPTSSDLTPPDAPTVTQPE